MTSTVIRLPRQPDGPHIVELFDPTRPAAEQVVQTWRWVDPPAMGERPHYTWAGQAPTRLFGPQRGAPSWAGLVQTALDQGWDMQTVPVGLARHDAFGAARTRVVGPNGYGNDGAPELVIAGPPTPQRTMYRWVSVTHVGARYTDDEVDADPDFAALSNAERDEWLSSGEAFTPHPDDEESTPR